MTECRPRLRALVTEADGPGQTLAACLRQGGAEVQVLPVVTHGPAPNPAPLHDALDRLPEYDWVAFTSARAVEALREHAAWQQWPWPTAERPRVAAVGPATRAVLLAHGVPVAICPESPGARTLARAIVAAEAGTLSGRTVLWPRSSIARPELRKLLRAAGAEVVAPVAYSTAPARPANLLDVLRDLEAWASS